ncbi:MAG: dienelactone hydrolase family protein [Pseudonocardiales bacterium]
MVSFGSNGATTEGYLAVPQSGSGPAVIVIQEWWGLVGHVTGIVDRFADVGFVALAPDLYQGERTAEPDEAQKLLMGLAMDRAGRDIAGAAGYLAGRPETASRHVGCVGFCMGGSLALWSATLSSDIVAAVGFYPAIPWGRMSPAWSAYDGKSAMLHCDEDEGGCAADGIRLAVTAIEQAGGTVTCFDYPGTGHAFFNDDRPEVYNAQAAEEAWSRTLNLFRATLT